MSDEIPFHIQEEIMKKLPVKSLVQFRSVSKAWKSLIDGSEFITAHSHFRHTQSQHLLVSYEDEEIERKYVSYVDDDTFPQKRSVSTLPVSNGERFYLLPGSSHGLFCLLKSSCVSEPGMAIIWNPSIRKSIVVPVPPGRPSVGLGVCPITGDPKIVAVTRSWGKSTSKPSYRCEVMVYTLSSGKWRSLSASLPTMPIQSLWCTMVTDRFIYWHAGSQTRDKVIVSFDVTTENFEVIYLPDYVANRRLCFSKLRESLVIVEYKYEDIGTVWMMEHGVEKAFTKLFTLKPPHDFVVGFRKSGIPIVKVTDGDPDDFDYDDQPSNLVVCEPNSEYNNVLESCLDYFTVDSYTETLILVGRSDCHSH